MDKVVVCMGSSCFSRGNGNVASAVQAFIKSHGLEGKVAMAGCLCRGECKNGPNVEVNGKVYGDVSEDNIADILSKALGV